VRHPDADHFVEGLPQAAVKSGLTIKASGYDFVDVKTDPDEGVLHSGTDHFVEGPSLVRFEKGQLIGLGDLECNNTGQDPSVLSNEYLSPFFAAPRTPTRMCATLLRGGRYEDVRLELPGDGSGALAARYGHHRRKHGGLSRLGRDAQV